MCHQCFKQLEQEREMKKAMGKCSSCDYSATSHLTINGKKLRFCSLHHYKHNLESEPSSKYRYNWEVGIAEIEADRKVNPYKGLYFEVQDKILKTKIDKLTNPNANDPEALQAYLNIRDLPFIKSEIKDKWEKSIKEHTNRC